MKEDVADTWQTWQKQITTFFRFWKAVLEDFTDSYDNVWTFGPLSSHHITIIYYKKSVGM